MRDGYQPNEILDQSELYDIIDTTYTGESELLLSVMYRAVAKFNINTTHELAITCETLDSLNDFPEGEGYGSSDGYWDLEKVRETLERDRDYQKEREELGC